MGMVLKWEKKNLTISRGLLWNRDEFCSDLGKDGSDSLSKADCVSRFCNHLGSCSSLALEVITRVYLRHKRRAGV
jgi:hypothetical protein